MFSWCLFLTEMPKWSHLYVLDRFCNCQRSMVEYGIFCILYSAVFSSFYLYSMEYMHVKIWSKPTKLIYSVETWIRHPIIATNVPAPVLLLTPACLHFVRDSSIIDMDQQSCSGLCIMKRIFSFFFPFFLCTYFVNFSTTFATLSTASTGK